MSVMDHDAPQLSTPMTDPVRPRTALAVLCACGTLVALLQTMVVPLIPQFSVLLAVSATSAS